MMTSEISRPDIYDPKTLAVMDQAFAAIWNILRADDPFRDYVNDSELRIAIGGSSHQRTRLRTFVPCFAGKYREIPKSFGLEIAKTPQTGNPRARRIPVKLTASFPLVCAANLAPPANNLGDALGSA
jgi:hypothetical protein